MGKGGMEKIVRLVTIGCGTAAMAQTLKRHVAAHPVIRVTSSESGFGIPEMRAELAALA